MPIDCAFAYCGAVTEIVIGDGLRKIEAGVFYECSSLINLTIGESVVTIGGSAFYGCDNLKNLAIPNSVKDIGYRAFYDCYGLENLIIGDNVVNIGKEAFYNCVSLVDLTIPNKVKTIETFAFYNCVSLEGIYFNASYCDDLSYNNYIFGHDNYRDSKNVSVIVNAIKVPKNLFASSVIESRRPKIVSITIGEMVSSIGTDAFEGCVWVKEINFNANSCADFSLNNQIFEKLGCEKEGVTVNIGNSVERIPAYLFYPNTNLSYSPKICSVNIGTNVVEIGVFAFYNCVDLKDLIFNAESCTDFGLDNNVFYKFGRNVHETTIVFGENVDRIPAYLFYPSSDATSTPYINSITIGKNIKSIGNFAFYNCADISKIIFKAENCADLDGIDNYVFANVGISGQGVTVVFEATVKVIPAYLFVPYYGQFVPKIVDIIWADDITKIGDYAFAYSKGLTDLKLPNKLNVIGYRAFCSSSLTSIVIPENVSEIGEWAFQDCDSLQFVKIGCGIEDIKNGVFYRCESLTSIIIGKNVSNIEASAFANCTALEKIYYLGTLKEWSDNIVIASGNEVFAEATRYYYIENQEDVPTDGGNYWHYDENGNIAVW